MVEQRGQSNPHIILHGFTETMPFRSPSGGGSSSRLIPEQNRSTHGALLLSQIDNLKAQSEASSAAERAAGLEDGFGLQVEFESFPEIELAFESLARERSGIELLNVRYDAQRYYATVFVPEGKLDLFERLIQDYLERKVDINGRPRDHRRLIDAIQQIREATLRALWTDDAEIFPTENDELFWWEVWLPIRGDREASISRFRSLADAQNLEVSAGELTFPERTVLLVHGTARQMTQTGMTLNSVAELRRAKETAEFFDSLHPNEQTDWLDNLIDRTNYAGPDMTVPYICLLDTGTNNGHVLIFPALSSSDLYTVEPDWGAADSYGHGTNMAGLALMGDITELLATSGPISIGHRLESVKLLPQNSANGNDAQHHGLLTVDAISRPEIATPNRERVFGMAVTAKDNRDRGRPSAWSAAVDSLASDAFGQGTTPRLLVISAGNCDPNAYVTYPDSNSTDGIHDPGQAWNALTIGAYTDLVQITETDASNYLPIASKGGISPFSTTSNTWQPQWPLKPDILFEGGNLGKDALGAVQMQSLSLLTTHHLPIDRLFTTMHATSAATALAARMAARLKAAYPALWPESIRALMVHSAEWTECMRTMFLPEGSSSKSDYLNLVRHCGFGVPDLDSALYSVANSLTMVEEEQLQPFRHETGKGTRLRDMNLHKLPWPLTQLEALGQTQVEMRVTLSYFIEPNPSARGFTSRYSYQSHALRFDVKRPSESEQDFRARINVAARDEEERTSTGGGDPAWLIGPRNRHRGSLHSDIWRGSAVDLASRGILAVYPASGWWRTRERLERYEKIARYSLIVSIRAPEVDVDLYSAITNQIATQVIV